MKTFSIFLFLLCGFLRPAYSDSPFAFLSTHHDNSYELASLATNTNADFLVIKGVDSEESFEELSEILKTSYAYVYAEPISGGQVTLVATKTELDLSCNPSELIYSFIREKSENAHLKLQELKVKNGTAFVFSYSKPLNEGLIVDTGGGAHLEVKVNDNAISVEGNVEFSNEEKDLVTTTNLSGNMEIDNNGEKSYEVKIEFSVEW